MSFFLSMLENMLGLTAEEQAQIEPCLPALKAIIDVVNAHMDDWWAFDQHFVVEQPTVRKLFSDFKVVGPAISALLQDSAFIDIGATTSAAQDMAAAWRNCPSAPALTSLVSRLQPTFGTIKANWPQARPAFEILTAAIARKHG